MARSLAFLCAVVVAAPAAYAGDPPAGQNNQPQLPVITNYPSAAQKAPAGGNAQAPLPTIVNLQAVAGLKAPEQPAGQAKSPPAPPVSRVVVFAENNAVMANPYASGYSAPAPFAYAPAYSFGYTPPAYGYGGMGYGFGYAPPMYSAGYTLSYAYWAQPRPLPTAVVSPAGGISTSPTGVVALDMGVITNR